MTDNNNNRDRDGAAAPLARRKWLPWALAALGVVLLLLILSRCNSRDADQAAVAPATGGVAATAPMPMAPTAPTTGVPMGVSTLGAYFAGADVAPRTFAFEQVHFDTGSAEIRAADRGEIQAVAAVLKSHPTSAVRLVGYADARGSDPKNVQLAQARANVVRSALAAAGIDARRVEAVSGGESNPVADNASSSGMAENRRTELVVVTR